MSAEYILVVATSTEEHQLELAAADLGMPFVKTRSSAGPYFDLGPIGAGGNRVIAVRVDMGPFGFDGSAASVIRHTTLQSARRVICLGMAFGVDAATQEIGDVLVSRALLPYDNRDVICDHGRHVIGWLRGTSPYVYDYSRVKIFLSGDSLFQLFTEHCRNHPFVEHDVQFGSILTGASRVFCAQYRDHLVAEVQRGIVRSFAKLGSPAEVPPIIGGEMEGVGLLSSAKATVPRWIVVKGISDFADGRSRESLPARREIACRNAARFVLHALQADE